MSAAYLVNPHHREVLKRAILAALGSSIAEQRRRMTSLRHTVRSWTSAHWANEFLGVLEAMRATAVHRSVCLGATS